jgi:hypothetical protein
MKHEKSLPLSQKIGIASLLALIAAIGAVWVFNVLHTSAPSRAEEVVRPIDTALIAAGAVRKCEVIAGGHHIASRGVGSTSYYEIKQPRENTTELIYRIAKENGFNLIQATPENRTDALAGIDDKFLSDWNFDDRSKISNFPDLEEGRIALLVALYNNESFEAFCGGDFNNYGNVKGNDGQTIIHLRTILPNLRQEYQQ